ncbi:MAG: superoxide dismutase [Capnocytophaga sp.]|nr:superoxide dismutase [Capnocytophaga sp.]
MKKIILSGILVSLTVACNCPQEKKAEEMAEKVVENVKEVISYGNPAEVKAEGKFQLTGLPYAYDDLEPSIDGRTMEIHYSKHYLGYTNNLNKAIAGTALENKTIEEILTELDLDNKAVRNNAGGYYNHSLFWEIMSPNKTELSGALLEKINADFGSVENFKNQFSDAAAKQFGSGWAWLVVNKDGKLEIGSTPNQDNPLMPKQSISGTPILALDVWEHAYYLNYQNQRPKYIEAFFSVINWDEVSKKYEATIKK